MAASGTRHVGRVTDPLARDDGESEPELELSDPEAAPAPAPAADLASEVAEISSESSPEPDAEPEPQEPEVGLEAAADPGVHPVRARLLARAAAVRQASSAPRRSGDLSSSSPARGGDLGLDELAGAAPPSAPAPGMSGAPLRPRGPLSPNMVALFGTLLGLALVASIIALAMRIGPSQGSSAVEAPREPSSEATEAAPSATKPARVKIPGPWRIADAKGDAELRIIEGKIGTLPFLKAIQEAGLDKKEAYRVFNVLKDVRNLDKCERSHSFIALLERSSGRVKGFEYVVTKEEVYQARQGATGQLEAKRLDFKIERARVQNAFVVDGSEIDEAAEKAGFERGLAQVLARALDGHYGLDELKRGDVIRVVAQEVTVLGEFSRYAGVEAVEIRRGDDPGKPPAGGEGGKPFRLYYFRGAKERGYYDDKGRSPYEGGWRKPVQGAPITSHFNPKRLHPVLKKIMPHTGTDFGAPTGAPVGASSYGTVSFIGPAGPSGNLVKVEHPGGIETGYAHLSRFAEGIKVGDKVKRLQLIGYVGSTGRSTGPHLHFTAKKNGEFFDAETLNLDGMRVIAKEERDAFAQQKRDYDQLLDAIPLPAPLPSPKPDVVAASASAEEGDSVDESFATGGPAQPAPAPSAAPAAPAPQAPTPGKPRAGAANPVYLSDEELLKSQSASDDGEVDE